MSDTRSRTSKSASSAKQSMLVEVAGRQYELSETLQSEELAPIFEDAWTASRVWEASLFLSDHLVGFARQSAQSEQSAHVFQVADGQPVVELGSGCGLVGLVAAALGADVVVTDQHEAVELLQRNLAANASSEAERRRLRVAEFVWGTPPEHSALPLPQPRAAFAYVLVSDCINPIYGAESWRNLARSIHALSDAHTITYVAHEARGDDEALTDFLHFSADFLATERIAQQGKLSLFKIRCR